jgi:hypothetical protein
VLSLATENGEPQTCCKEWHRGVCDAKHAMALALSERYNIAVAEYGPFEA